LVTPSDHLVTKEEAYQKAVHHAQKLSFNMGNLVTFGIQPEFPETGFGYIEVPGKPGLEF
jgi:mannose-1-phosphate guanylyltransferase